MKNKKLKICCGFIVIISMFFIPSSVRADGIEDILVGSDVLHNANLKIELYVYKANDADPYYDYLFVRVFVSKWAYRYDGFVGLSTLNLLILCDSSGVNSLEAYRAPNPGVYMSESQAVVSYYGFGIQVPIPAGTIEYYPGPMVAWYCNKLPFWWAPAVTIGGTGFTIGFRINEDAAATISTYSYAAFYHTFWGIPLGWGSGPVASVYAPGG